MRKTPILTALGALLLVHCASLDAIPENVCGNGVVEAATEDCDTFPATSCGAPNSGAQACRFVCSRTDDTAPKCPAGFGCSLDGVCNELKGTFKAMPTFSAAATTLLTGDFDNDGRADLVSAPAFGSNASARVHFFDEEASLAGTTTVDVALRLPLVRDFDGDGVDDLGFAIFQNDIGAFGALAGRGDRTFSTVLFPSVTVPQTTAKGAVINIDPTRTALPQTVQTPQPELSALVLVETDKDGGHHLRNINNNTASGDTTSLNLTLPIGPADLVGRPRTGILFTPSDRSACGEVVLGFNDGEQGKLVIAQPCARRPDRQSFWEDRGSVQTISLTTAGGARLKLADGGVFVGRYDADDLDDVFIATPGTDTDGVQVYVATSTGTALRPFQPVTFELPLAIGDLDNDGTPDLVLPTGLRPIDSDGGPGEIRPQPGFTFTEARIGNFNGDGIPDVFARYGSALDAPLLANNGDGRFTTFTVPSDQPIQAIEAGDFDGDRILDVAFLQSPRAFSDVAGSGEIELRIAYGKANGGPEAPRVIGRFENARELHVLHTADSPVDNLAVVSIDPTVDAQGSPSQSTNVTVLFGSGERQPIAPLFLRDENSQSPYSPSRSVSYRVWDPLILQAGALLTEGQTDVVSIAAGITVDIRQQQPGRLPFIFPFPMGFWVATHQSDTAGSLGTFVEAQDLTSAFRPLDRLELLNFPLVATTGDIDFPANRRDEIVGFTETAAGVTTLFILRTSDGRVTEPVPHPELTVTSSDPIDLGDLDGDGAPELVLVSGGPGARKARVFLHEGESAFAATAMEVPLPTSDAGTAADPVAFAFLPSGVTPGGKVLTRLAIVTARQLYLATLRDDRSGFDVVTLPDGLGTGEQLTSVVVGDFDGDGVPDLALADSGSVTILKQRTRE